MGNKPFQFCRRNQALHFWPIHLTKCFKRTKLISAGIQTVHVTDGTKLSCCNTIHTIFEVLLILMSNNDQVGCNEFWGLHFIIPLVWLSLQQIFKFCHVLFCSVVAYFIASESHLLCIYFFFMMRRSNSLTDLPFYLPTCLPAYHLI